MDCKKIATEVYALAGQHSDPLAPLVKEALEVIDQCLDTHGWVLELYFSSKVVV
jgi:FAD synthetase